MNNYTLACNRTQTKYHASRTNSTPQKQCKKIAGFSLFEILIVLSIAMILLAVAVPNYHRFVTKERRTDAHNLLLANGSQLTKCLTLAGSYDSNCRLIVESKDKYYVLNTELTQTTWTITALPNPDKAQIDDDECQSITLNHLGVKGSSAATPSACW